MQRSCIERRMLLPPMRIKNPSAQAQREHIQKGGTYKKYEKCKNICFENMSFLKVLGKTDFRFKFSVQNYVFQHRFIFFEMSKLEVSNCQNALKMRFSGFGSVKKKILMVQSCLEYISKLILIGKSLANHLNY